MAIEPNERPNKEPSMTNFIYTLFRNARPALWMCMHMTI